MPSVSPIQEITEQCQNDATHDRAPMILCLPAGGRGALATLYDFPIYVGAYDSAGI
jgi:hypothetical protein